MREERSIFEPAKYSGYDRRVYEMVEPKSRVLDVGCGLGDLAAALAEKDCSVVGIELDREMVSEARKKCKKVIQADVEKLRRLPFPRKHFDVMIFSDVLEHLRKPDIVLSRFRDYLSDDGYAVIAIPNIAFLSTRLSLLLGKFRYTEIGILDRTHLRFFTLRTAKELVEKSGFKVETVKSYIPVQKKYFALRIGGAIWKTLLSMKFIVKAKKAPSHFS